VAKGSTVGKETKGLSKDGLPTVKVRVRRGTADRSWYDEYRVPIEDGQSVFSVLQYIYDHLDPTLAFTGSCRIGLCSCCLVRVNGKVVRACTTLIKEDIQVDPYKKSCTVRDLIVAPSPGSLSGNSGF